MPVSSKVLNTQKEKVLSGHELPIMEAFYTLQGEGVHTGKPAFFIRTAGCDVGCHWCDVKESWDPEAHPVLSTGEIVRQALKYPSKMAVITGGEPLMYPMDPLTQELKAQGFSTHIETSGAYDLSGSWDWVCLSPKKRKPPVDSVLRQADELKVVVYNRDDFKWAEEHAAAVSTNCQLLLQPEWSKSDEVLPLIIDYIKEHPKWQISLQTHKFMRIP